MSDLDACTAVDGEVLATLGGDAFARSPLSATPEFAGSPAKPARDRAHQPHDQENHRHDT